MRRNTAKIFKSTRITIKIRREKMTAIEGYIELPQDSEGEYIHLDDNITIGESNVISVANICFYADGSALINGVYTPSEVTKYTSPLTIEDVLQMLFAGEMDVASATNAIANIVTPS